MSDGMARAEEIFELLSRLYRGFVDVPRGRREAESHREAPLSISFSPGDEAGDFARRLLDTIRARSPGPVGKPTFEMGRVYCYNCESTACSHAVPPDNLSVFAGYAPTGFPIWSGFFTLLLDRKDHRIDDLVDDSPEIAALCQGPKELKAEQLVVFGRESALYDIVGQVVVGYLPLPRGRNQSRVAVTLQAVRCLSGNRPRLFLNVIGRIRREDGETGDLVDFLKLEPELELAGLFSRARKRLDEVEMKNRFARRAAGGAGRVAAVASILTRLARGIESIYRRGRRRTRHAAERRGERPAVGLALKDLGKAHPDRVLFDELEHTFIVIGPKWRVHVFGRDGRHVTSLVLNRDGFQKRIDSRRWRYTTREEMKEIRSKAACFVPENSGVSSGGRPRGRPGVPEH